MTPFVASPQLVALLAEQDRTALRLLERTVPQGPADAERIAAAIVVLRERLGIDNVRVTP